MEVSAEKLKAILEKALKVPEPGDMSREDAKLYLQLGEILLREYPHTPGILNANHTIATALVRLSNEVLALQEELEDMWDRSWRDEY